MSDSEPGSGRPDLMDQYQFYAATTSDVSNRRLRTNQFYLSLLSGILVVLPFVLDLDNPRRVRLLAMLTVGLVGVVVSVVWFFNILSYRQLNGGKYAVVHEMEEHLPYDCFTREWELLGEGEDSRRYITHWKVERLVPWLVAIPYLVLVVYALSGLI